MSMYSVLNTLSKCTYFYMSKNITSAAFNVSLNNGFIGINREEVNFLFVVKSEVLSFQKN